MPNCDARAVIDNGPMRLRQWAAVALTITLNALDGFDVLSSAFAGPGIKQEWHLGPDGLGAILSMELIGMGIGSLFLGGAADKFGRRPTILACLMLMAAGMFLAATAASPQSLSIYRVITGLGIGGMLAAINAVAFEYSNLRYRSFAMSIMVIGYPIGAFLGGLIAAMLLTAHDWRAVFLFGGVMTTICLPLVLWLIPETPAWLAQARPAGALEKINRTLRRLGHAPIDALGTQAPHEVAASLVDIFKPAYARATLVLSLGYAAHALSFYYILKMAPSIISDPQFAGQHFTKAQGAGVLAYANLGGAIGGACFGWCMHRFGIKRATMAALLISVIMVARFGLGATTLGGWTWAVVLTGLFTNAAIVGFYAAFAASYPTHVKATGTGFALSIGRGGAALSPYLAGVLFSEELGLMAVSIIMAAGSLVALVLFAFLPVEEKR
ncbi:benzoate transport [Novosphingobium sp. CF614]|uniref:MFS transporter n=1 Tax=Novosphingobium sp. CF614 TaxID=1884364 RepID=UPI0008E56275|nr:MFS transporter [Novosphingobium sp. CF614]SFG44321.1 benzoate transport [Novosphingobium sp. CF614]